MGTREGRYLLKLSFVFICFPVFICVISSEEYNKFIEQGSELPKNSIIKSQKSKNADGWPFGDLPSSVPLLGKNFNYNKVPAAIPLYYTPSLRYKRRIYIDFDTCSQLTYFGYNLDRSSNGFCTTASECLESALLSFRSIKREEEDLLMNVIKMSSNVFQPTCLYKDSNGFMKYGVCCKKHINNSVEKINEILNGTFTNKIIPKGDDISTYNTRGSSGLIDRGHIFSRPKKNVQKIDEPSSVTSSSSTKFKIDQWGFPFFHPTHPPIITHPPEHTNKPWWTTRWPITTTTHEPSRQYDWWEIRKTDQPDWWQQQSTTSRYPIPPREEEETTTRRPWWQPDTTRWWVQRYTTSSPKTSTWQRHFTTPTTTTTTTTPSTTSTTTTTTRPSLPTADEYCLPSFYKKAKNLPVFENEEKDVGEAIRITGGTKIYPHSYPWIAVLFQSGKHVCGGSLIDDTHVLTAAHCVATLSSWQLKRMRVYLGMHDLSRSEATKQSYTIKTVVRHKDYSRSLLYNDIALLTLNERVRFTDQVHPICLYEGSNTFNNDVATVAGWGSLYEGGNQLDTPRKVDLRIWSNEDCRSAYGAAAPGGIISSHLCAGRIGKDACSGDSGGPIMKQINGVWMQIGIVSWGIGCGKGHYPGVYSRISTFLPWIRKVQGNY